MIGGGDGALGDVERLIRCSKITVQLIVRILLSMLVDVSFRLSSNYPVKSRTKYIHKDIRTSRTKSCFYRTLSERYASQWRYFH